MICMLMLSFDLVGMLECMLGSMTEDLICCRDFYVNIYTAEAMLNIIQIYSCIYRCWWLEDMKDIMTLCQNRTKCYCSF